MPEVSGHPRELLNKVMVAVDRAMQRRDAPDGRKLTVLDLHSKVSTLIWALRTLQISSAASLLLCCPGAAALFAPWLPHLSQDVPSIHPFTCELASLHSSFSRLQEAEEFRRSLIRYELEMLKAFGFVAHVEHPHKLLLNYCQVLGLDAPAASLEPEQAPSCPEFLQEAWNVANDR